MLDSINFQDLVLYGHLICTVGMFSVIWFVQISHYPLLNYVPEESFKDYERAHIYRVSFIVGPLMLVEVLTASCLIFLPFEGMQFYLVLIGFLLVIINWLSTLFFQIPCHKKLEQGKDNDAIARLINTNWIRTIVWSIRAFISVCLIISIS